MNKNIFTGLCLISLVVSVYAQDQVGGLLEKFKNVSNVLTFQIKTPRVIELKNVDNLYTNQVEIYNQTKKIFEPHIFTNTYLNTNELEIASNGKVDKNIYDNNYSTYSNYGVRPRNTRLQRYIYITSGNIRAVS